MKSRGFKYLQLFLVLVVIAAGSGYACAGSAPCSSPCCRHGATDTNHHGAAGNARGSCDTTGPSAGAAGKACRLAVKDYAATPEIKTGIGPSTCIVAYAENPPVVQASGRIPVPIREAVSHPIPIFLQFQALLI
jgi:hypothetical protein